MIALESLTRWKAFGLHLVLSALIALTVIGLVVALWYPQPYFSAMGGDVLLRLLIGVDVVLGPLITLIIFDPKKPRLKYDLATIAVLQIAALVYGSYVMFEARPAYAVFLKDRFETVPAYQVDADSRAKAPAEFRDLPLGGPRVVAVKPPANPQEMVQIALAHQFKGGPDLPDLPHLYTSYGAAAPDVVKSARPLVGLSRKDKAAADAVTAFVAANGNGERNLGFVPVKARQSDFSAVVDRKTGEIVGYLAINPW